ncbi:GSCFA domain-containing protein [Limibaculum sp. M0105]|uniref:GSCFA domain-containing protein n=1 Tax=Thermohalobaculum xanthum TaxID=2753746 RepID=A0A8J7SHM9_9RHOB|nr:GSCFA domain-containing protein [Thermohalobaculum xanthum]MBK0400857.1 GSCFA domain-containing protein [Thermohalobaculum xanthum]
MTMRISVFGSCQSDVLARALEVMLGGAEAEACMPQRLGRLDAEGVSRLLDADLVLAARNFEFPAQARPDPSRVVTYPTVFFRGFHPDMAHLIKGGEQLSTAFGPYHSAIAYAAHRLGYSRDEAVDLYCDAVFEKLGYYAKFDEARQQLADDSRRCDLPLEGEVDGWLRGGCFMHTYNHPKFRVIGTVARLLLDKLGIEPRIETPEDFAEDPLLNGAVWSVYPGIAERLGLAGAFAFRGPKRMGARFGGLEDLVAASYELYDQPKARDATPVGVDLEACEAAFAASGVRGKAGHGKKSAGRGTRVRNPYVGLPPHQFWRKAVSEPPLDAIDPVVDAPFTIARTDRLGSAGSCFAQHIARTLQRSGYNYFVPEAAPEGITDAEAAQKNYGVFSARYGNIYTARQLVQLFDRAHGRFDPADRAWLRPDGRYADPFRPQIEPDGFATEDAVEEARAAHLAAVRTLFADVDVFVFTLGLTEAWEATADGAVFPLAPGVAAGAPDPARYRFVNFTAAEVEADMLGFLDRLREVNPSSRAVITVSPVPLVATYEPRSVITSTCYSKSALRVAAEQICRARPGIAYYPSYELITGQFTRGAYFEDDLRNVTPDGVAHAMRLFVQYYGEPEQPAEDAEPPVDPLFKVICDEERLDSDA